jgi:hypothetical protein
VANGLQSDGIVAQSIGGGGGTGGDASGTGAGINMTIGGSAGAGGNGGNVMVSSGPGDLVSTTGDHSVGLMLQSIGGGSGGTAGNGGCQSAAVADRRSLAGRVLNPHEQRDVLQALHRRPRDLCLQ